MNNNKIQLAAGGYSQKNRRKPRVKLDLTDPDMLQRIKFEKLRVTLDSVGGHRAKAAELLGISRRTIFRWIKEMGS